MAGGGSSSSSSTPVDMTPQAFKGLQGPYASVLGQLLGFNITNPNGTSTNPVSFTYPGGQFNGSGNGSMGSQQTGAGQTSRPNQYPSPHWTQGSGGNGGTTMDPFTPQGRNFNGGSGGSGAGGFTVSNPNLGTGNPNDILNGIPTYGGPLTAGMGGNENNLLQMLMGNSGAGQGTSAGVDQSASSFLQNTMNGQYLPGNTGPDGLAQYNSAVNGAHSTAAYDPNSENPFLQAAISNAQRPTLQGLTETLTQDLPGRFTQAGQFAQPQGSSAFDRAAAIATRGAADANAGIATNMAYQQFNDQANRSFQATQAARGAEDQSMAAQLTRQNDNSQKAQDRQVSAAGIAPQVSSTQVNNMVQNLQAQALPRLIQEYGIERGMQEFNNRTNTLLSVLGIAGGTTQPTVANKSESSSSQKPNLLPML